MPETDKKVPMRRCVGCMNSFPKDELIRIVRNEEGVQPDLTKKMQGRGCYICKDPRCLEMAMKKNGFARSFKCRVSKEELERISSALI